MHVTGAILPSQPLIIMFTGIYGYTRYMIEIENCSNVKDIEMFISIWRVSDPA